MASSSHEEAESRASLPVTELKPDKASLPRGVRRWLIVVGVVGTALFFSQLMEIPVRSALRGYDNTFNYLWLRSAAVDGDWDFRNDLEACNTLVPEQRASALALPLTPAQRIPNKYGIGWALLSTPFYLVADGIVALGRATGAWTLTRDGYNPVYQICLQAGHLVLALFSLLFATRTVASWIGDRVAAVSGVVLVWAASPLLYYQTVNLSMSHATAFFCVALHAYSLEAARKSPACTGAWLLAGAALGLAIITRFQLAVFGLAAFWPLYCGARRGGRLMRSAALLAVGAVPFLLLQLYAWRSVYGAWVVFSYGAEGEGFDWAKPEVFNTLFSSWHGLFYWHPFLLVATAGMLGWAWERRSTGIAWLVAFVLTAYVSGAWWCWWFASSFGNRSFDAALLPLMAGVGWLVARSSPRWHALLWSAGIAAGIWNFYVVLLFRSGAISRHAPVSWAEMLQAADRLREAVRF